MKHLQSRLDSIYIIPNTHMKFNQSEGDLKAVNGESLTSVDDFLYLGSWISCSKDVNARILDTIWKPELSDSLKTGFFRATVETVLMYGSTAWTLTQPLDKQLDGAHTKMLSGEERDLTAEHYK